MKKAYFIILALGGGILMPSLLYAHNTVEERVRLLEQTLQNPIRLEINKQLEHLQQEIRELRGLLEEQEHSIKQLTKHKNKSNDKVTDAARIDIRPTSNVPATRINPGTPAPKSSTAIQNRNIQDNKQEAEAYQHAYGFVSKKKFIEAAQAFREMLTLYPSGQYAANAHYWLGEIEMAEWQHNKTKTAELEKAKQEFLIIISTFPTHHKASDALLKLGVIALAQNDKLTAQKYLNEVKSQFKGSPAARIAETKLQHLSN